MTLAGALLVLLGMPLAPAGVLLGPGSAAGHEGNPNIDTVIWARKR